MAQFDTNYTIPVNSIERKHAPFRRQTKQIHFSHVNKQLENVQQYNLCVSSN